MISDELANPSFIAADILAQAEHDPDAFPVLLKNSPKLAEEVNREIEHQLIELKTAEITIQSLNSFLPSP